MEAVGGLLTGFGVILTLDNLFFCFLGSLIGTLVGVLPGVGPLAALALLLPITFTMTPVGGMVMLASIFYGAMYGGSTTSILLNRRGRVGRDLSRRSPDGEAGARRRGPGDRGDRLVRRRHTRRDRDDVLCADDRGGRHSFRTP